MVKLSLYKLHLFDPNFSQYPIKSTRACWIRLFKRELVLYERKIIVERVSGFLFHELQLYIF